MGWVESLQKAIDYMEEHLLDNITIESIAKQANTSAYHFQRTFTILTDLSVGEYLRQRRLTLAAQELSRSNCKIIDLAYKYGYDTPEAFSKAFRRQHGVSPSEVQKYSGGLVSYNRLVIQVHLKGAEPMKCKVVQKDSFQLVGIKREFSYVNEQNLIEIPKLWNQVNSDGTCERICQLNDGPLKGVLGVCVSTKETQANQSMEYWIAAEHMGEVPDGLSKLEVPASKWVVFEVIGAMPDAMQKAWKQIYSEWFPSSGYEHGGAIEFELYTDDDPYSPDCYSEIWIPVK